MDSIGIMIGAALVGAILGWFLGRGAGARTWVEAVRRLTAQARQGGSVDAASAPPELRSLVDALGSRAAPAAGKRDDARMKPAEPVVRPERDPTPDSEGAEAGGMTAEEALWAALKRVSLHLEHTVEQPLQDAAKGDSKALRMGVGEALGALEDIEFFLTPVPRGAEEFDLGDAVADVLRTFQEETGTRAKQRGPRRPITVRGNPDGLQDALFLVLHNAVQFGGGSPIDVVVRLADGLGRVHVRDRGDGFSAEALARAYDPFYTTVDGNLGLGLAHARRLIEDGGGKIHLRNAERGGGEVEIGLPSTNPRRPQT